MFKNISFLDERIDRVRLNFEEEVELFRRWTEDKDESARQELIECNVWIAELNARKYYNFGASLDLVDLVQEGVLGLYRAIDKFEPERGFRFSTYASWWVRSYVGRAARSESRAVTLPSGAAEKLASIEIERNKFKARNGRLPTTVEISDSISLSKKDMSPGVVRRTIDNCHVEVVSLNNKIPGREDSYLDQIEDEMDTPDKVVEDEFLKHDIIRLCKEFAGKLNHKRSIVFYKRIYSKNPLTLKVIGQEIGLTRERVRQIEKRLLEDLRDYIKEKMPDLDLAC
jgi:RNA polymerase sigma factor (sigma-70 family)